MDDKITQSTTLSREMESMPETPDTSFYEDIKELARAINDLAKTALAQLKPEVDALIRSRCKDEHTIELLLDRLLDYAPYEGGLPVFKRLLRYYYPLNPGAVASYIDSYKEMYDSDDAEQT
jgi:hypothetical protein